ncbi:MAG: response regulator [Sphingomonadaceae bacterium]|nr:response regulator [Sphingomonadaceae bacterium]
MASQALTPQEQSGALQTQAPAQMPSVLVVDNDRECISHCARMLDDLNYRHNGVASAREALELLIQDPTIQIVVASTQMPMVDGFVLVEEARARIGHTRPLAVIITTDLVTTDLAVKGLHVEAVDLLCKPLGFEEYSSALRRANRYLGTRRAIADGASISNFGQHLGRLVTMLEGASLGTKTEGRATDKDISATLRTIISSRGLRSRYFPSQIFADPAWDILLDLTRAKLDGQQVSVSSVCIAASVPMSTALRWVKQMTEAGLLTRWTDPKDRRRDLIALTDPTADNMREYLIVAHSAFSAL